MITKIEEVHVGNGAEIKLSTNENEKDTGLITKIISQEDSDEGILVVLKNGSTGYVIQILQSVELALERIEQETHFRDNKDCFYKPVMREDEIPKTIQSFLNSDGGYLYIGIKDDEDKIEDKIVGLGADRENLEQSAGISYSDGKFKDKLVTQIEGVLEKLLTGNLGKFLDYNFWKYNEKIFLEIVVKKSTYPVFYRYFSRKGNAKVFQIFYKNNKITDRKLDEFHFRDGSGKKHCETFEEYQEYYEKHFENS
jgi:hypothetical protein